ncbi:Uncharacterised protein [Lederbergia lenta]|uniref:Uncharacterized protein n=1 Tax=Lederbergia lenta TaxID=1467 RepID=A0A2X4YY98_LEDLE|nr:Uncharacterised protein [Lederbergia lenta]
MITQNANEQFKESTVQEKMESSVVYIRDRWLVRMVCVIP